MAVEEWIGSLISLLALATLFFFNQRNEEHKEQGAKHIPKKAAKEREEWVEFLGVKDPPKVKNKKPPLPKTQSLGIQKKQHPNRRIVVEDADEWNDYQPVLKSSRVSRLRPIPPIHGEFVDRSPKVRKKIKSLENLSTLVICREVIERPNKNI